MTEGEAYAAGYEAGQKVMRQRAAACCHFDVYNIAQSIQADIEKLAAVRPIVNKLGDVLLKAEECSAPPGGNRALCVTWAWRGPFEFNTTGTTKTDEELDKKFPGWRWMAVPLPGTPSFTWMASPSVPSPVPPSPVPPVLTSAAINRSEAPEPPGGFKALSEEKLWRMMWAAGYDLPPAVPYSDPKNTSGFYMTKVTAGPFAGLTVCVGEVAGEWASCELGTKAPDDLDWFAAVRRCNLTMFQTQPPSDSAFSLASRTNGCL